MLHYTSDVGRLKIDSAIDKLTAINPFVQLERFDTYLSSQNALDIFSGFDIIADGTDNFATRYLVNDACVLSAKAVDFLRQSGFKRATNLAGGILAWASKIDPSLPKY